MKKKENKHNRLTSHAGKIYTFHTRSYSMFSLGPMKTVREWNFVRWNASNIYRLSFFFFGWLRPSVCVLTQHHVVNTHNRGDAVEGDEWGWWWMVDVKYARFFFILISHLTNNKNVCNENWLTVCLTLSFALGLLQGQQSGYSYALINVSVYVIL